MTSWHFGSQASGHLRHAGGAGGWYPCSRPRYPKALSGLCGGLSTRHAWGVLAEGASCRQGPGQSCRPPLQSGPSIPGVWPGVFPVPASPAPRAVETRGERGSGTQAPPLYRGGRGSAPSSFSVPSAPRVPSGSALRGCLSGCRRPGGSWRVRCRSRGEAGSLAWPGVQAGPQPTGTVSFRGGPGGQPPAKTPARVPHPGPWHC